MPPSIHTADDLHRIIQHLAGGGSVKAFGGGGSTGQGAIADLLNNVDWLKHRIGSNIQSLVSDPVAHLQQKLSQLAEEPDQLMNLAGGEGGMGMAGVIKPKGGQWLSGSVEDALSGLKQDFGSIGRGGALHPDDAAINNWVGSNLTKYVKNLMGTPEDPVRALAEQGVLHVNPDQLTRGHATVHPSGDVLSKLGQSQEAKSWENASDNFIYPEEARTFLQTRNGETGVPTVDRNPWLTSVSPETPVYDLAPLTHPHDLGFDHIIDVLNAKLQEGSLRPETLNRVSVPDAVQFAHDFNAAQAKKMADAQLSAMQDIPVHKDYGDGMKWMELRHNPDALPEGWSLQKSEAPLGGFDGINPAGNKIYLGTDEDAANRALASAVNASGSLPLAKWLQQEGDAMGHCVGGYCDDVLSGRSRIFSLRDAKGEPHVTVEVTPGDQFASRDRLFDLPTEEYAKVSKRAEEILAQGEITDLNAAMTAATNEMLGAPAQKIVQIKGKQNKAPNPEYLPFVQDFVKNPPTGQSWSDVGDLKNTGLYKRADRFPQLQEGPDYMNEEEAAQARRSLGLDDPVNDGNNFAQGGTVSRLSKATPSPVRTHQDLKQLIASLQGT